jgi:hypothetical protein
VVGGQVVNFSASALSCSVGKLYCRGGVQAGVPHELGDHDQVGLPRKLVANVCLRTWAVGSPSSAACPAMAAMMETGRNRGRSGSASTTVAARLLTPKPVPSRVPRRADTPPADLGNEIGTQLQRLKWFCWHGSVFRALLQTVDGILVDLDTAEPGPEQARLLKAVREFDADLRANAGRISNYGERHRSGEAISTAFTESAANQVISKRMAGK